MGDESGLSKGRQDLHYNQFSVESASKEYPLTIEGFTREGSYDPFVTHPLNGMKFTTAY